MRVYRVENGKGQGPYSVIPRRELKSILGRKHASICASLKRPLPQDDGIDMGQDTNLVCGFRTMSQLKEWFTPRDIIVLLQLGFFINVYESSHVLKGTKQVMFHK